MSTFYREIDHTNIPKSEDILLDSGVEILIDLHKIKIDIPLASTDKVYYKKHKNTLQITNDIRLLYSPNEELNSAGITSLLLLGTIVPPLTPFKNIHALLPGFSHKIDPNSLEFKSIMNCHWSSPTEEDYKMSLDDQITILANKIDETLKKSCPSEDPILSFSGGVDSSVLAMRIVAMGWKNASFVHYSFGDNDPETKISREIAESLGFTLDIIYWEKDRGFDSLENAAKIYRQPFCDHGTVHGYLFAKEITKKYSNSRTILDGTGADGAFGSFGIADNSKRLYKLPLRMRKLFSVLYGKADFWKNTTKLEYYVRLLRRSSALSELLNATANNPLYNISYIAKQDNISSISSLCEKWIWSVAQSQEQTITIPLIRVALKSSGKSSQRIKSIFSESSFQIDFPFMKQPMIDLAVQHARFWPGCKQPKKPLKHLLATSIRPDLVYRKSQGFLGPLQYKFSHPIFIKYLNQLKNEEALLYNVVNKEMLKKMSEHIMSNKNLPLQTYNFLWAITFTNAWLTQLEQVASDLKKRKLDEIY